MKTRFGIYLAAAVAAVIIASPLALAAGPTHGDTFMKKAIAGNLSEIKVGELAQQ